MGARSSTVYDVVEANGTADQSAKASSSRVAKQDQKKMKKIRAVPSGMTLDRREKVLMSRQVHLNNPHTMQKPQVSIGTLYEDSTFPLRVEQDRFRRPVNVSWKRPKDYLTDAKTIRLYGDKVNRYSVKQGQVGDCFYMSSLSAIAEHPKYLKEIMPANAYRTAGRKYRGIFHCRFWWLGEWIDIYADDRLPYDQDVERVFGGHSNETNVVWVSLMEKAMARLCKGYASVGGDQSAAYILLTGGIVEEVKVIKRQQEDVVLPPEAIFKRVRAALKSGSAALTGIDEKENNSHVLKGLVTNHAYQITSAIKLKQEKQKVQLLKIRNPWGEKNKMRPENENGEWKGRWSYESGEWKSVSKRLQKKHNVEYEKGGDFWVCMEDFCKIFGHIYFADTVPNFDEDGFRKKDKLNQVINILGEWHGETAAGNEPRKRFKNPRYVITIPSTGLLPETRTSVVLQLIQQYENAVSQVKDAANQLYCRLNVFRIEKKKVLDNRLHACLTELTNPDTFVGSRFISYRYKFSPGKYLLVPTYLEKNVRMPVNRTFCIRVFTETPLKCSQMQQYPVAMSGKPSKSFESADLKVPVNRVYSSIAFGEWKGLEGTGSDEVRQMKNPKFILTVPGYRSMKVGFQLRHSTDVEQTPFCRLDVFKIHGDIKRKKQRWMVLHEITNADAKVFVGGPGVEISNDYELFPGRYLLLPNRAKAGNVVCSFCLRCLANTRLQCRPLSELPILFVRSADSILEHENQQFDLQKIDFKFGEWLKDKTAGGPTGNASFQINPKYELTVSGTKPQPVLIDLLQEIVAPTYAIGYLVIQFERGQQLDEILRSSDERRMRTVAGRMHPMIESSESSDYYKLNPGLYVVFAYTSQPTNEKKFSLLIASQHKSKVKLTDWK